MSKPRLFPSLVLIAIFLAACAPATGTASPEQPVVGAGTASPSLAPTLDSSAQATPGPTDTPAPLPSPAATSRGPELHATDPATVSLASGGLQLVEFFRFT
jgi:hypothetical protein